MDGEKKNCRPYFYNPYCRLGVALVVILIAAINKIPEYQKYP